MMKYLQKLGKALMLPVAVLPICGILMGLGFMPSLRALWAFPVLQPPVQLIPSASCWSRQAAL